MLERQKQTKNFVNEAISLYRHCNKYLPKFLITNVAKHAYINMNSLNHEMLDKLKSTFFQVGRAKSKQSLPEQKTMLIERSKSIKKGE